jgi:flagellar hook assembly protein FlgD
MDAKPKTGIMNRAHRVQRGRSPRRAARGVRLGLRFAQAALALFVAFVPCFVSAQQFTAKSLGDYGNVTVMEVQGNYNADNPDSTVNAVPRQAIAQEFFKTHKDEYDYLVIFTNFDFAMPDKEKAALGFFEGVKNEIQGLGLEVFDYTTLYGSNGKLQGTIDMGNLAKIANNPLDPKFEETLGVLSHEMMHRWAAYVKFKDANGAISSAMLGRDSSHWSFLLDSGGSLMYGNKWQDNGNGSFTSTTPQSEMKFYNPLELYLMGMLDKSKVPPMLLITNPDVDTTQLPQAGVTVTGTGQYITIDQIIAAMGPRVPSASTSQKSFKTAFILVTQPGTFTGSELYGIENIRSGQVTRFSVLTDGAAILQVASTQKDNVPVPPVIVPPSNGPRTLPPNINDGVAWLTTNQQPDGSWKDLGQTTERDTAESTLALRSFTATQTNYQNGLQWLTGVSSVNIDFLNRKIQAFASSGQDVTSLVSDLTSRQNTDGGWGSDKSYASNPTDTALALKALSAAGYIGQQTISPAITYLKTSQNTDGGWGSEDKVSTVQETSNVLSAFNQYRAAYQLDDAITRATALLVIKQNSDGGFGNSPSTVYDSALATMTLAELNASLDTTSKSLAYILGQQADNGSWNQSAYQTALAVSAVYKATVTPDLSIKTEDISFIPATINTLPTNVVINANIWNLGRTSVPQAKVVLYDGNPAAGAKIGEQTLAFPGQASTTVTFSAVVNDGNEHLYTIVVDPDNLVKESSKLNNASTTALYPQATYDFEILSSNITVSANPANFFQDVTITSQITNKGTMNAYIVQVKYYIDDPTTPFEIATQTVDIPAGATITNTTTWKANKSGVNLPLTVLVDPFNTFTELSKTNNKATIPISVNADTSPNLTVSYKDIVITPSPVNQGGNASISAVVKNEGFSPSQATTADIYLGVPGVDGSLIGTQTVPALVSGQSAAISQDWTNIGVTGEKIIYVRVDPANLIHEATKADNDAFVTLNILSLPDLAVSTNSITYAPVAPKEGDPVTITVLVQNKGEQGVSNALVRLSEGGIVLADRTIPALASNATGTVSLVYDTTGKKGPHTITATVDPDNLIAEQSKDNNTTSNTFGVQDSNLWVTEPYFSPNGDGVKDSTQFFFRLAAPATVTVSAINGKGEAVRTFSGATLTNIAAGSIIWDGLNNDGMVVPDGQYQLQVMVATNNNLGGLSVIIDNNRSPLTEAIGTKFLLNSNMTCELPYIWPENWDWLANESGVVFTIPYNDSNTPDYPAGIYMMTPTGDDVVRIVPQEWTGANPLYAYSGFSHRLSPDRKKVAFTFWKSDKSTRASITELWVTDTDSRNLTLLEVSDLNYSLDDMKWSPDGNYLAYTRYQYAGYFQLWIINITTMAKTRIDSGAYYYPNIEWSPDGSDLAYIATNRSSFADALRKSDRLGNKNTIYTYDNNGSKKIAWLDSQGMAGLSGNSWSSGSLWLFDMSGNGNHVHLSENANEIALAPNRLTFVFAASANNAASLYISDMTGNAGVVHEFQNTVLRYGPQLSNIVWSADGGKIALIEADATCVDCSGIPSSFVPNLVIIDRNTGNKMSHPLPAPVAFKSWLSDKISLAGSTDNAVYVMNTKTGVITPLVSEVRVPGAMAKLVSPMERYITYEKPADPSSVCYSKGYVDLWSSSSLLNLTADLRAIKDRSAVILKGIASDRNFEGSRLDYADVKSPDNWNTIAPPPDVPVINDVFTTWVPPYAGEFYVRLTVWDKAGNAAVSQKRVSWGQYSSITNLYKSLEIFSPNGDGVKDTVELHYKVLEPVHIEFNIYDDNDKLVRTFLKDYTTPLDDFITWDGKDESLNVVPDGKYKIKVLDFEFFVEVDNTPPDVRINFNGIRQDPNSGALYAELQGHAVDNKFKSWILEYGEGDNPQEWTEYKRGESQVVGTDDKGNPILNPVQDASVVSFKEERVGWLANKKFRIIAEDYAGNKSTAITSFIEEKIIITKHFWENPSDLLSGGIGYQVFFLAPPKAYYLLLLPHPHTLVGLETVRTPIASANVQYYTSDHNWVDSSTVVNSLPGYVSLGWNPSGIKQQFSAVRVKAVDMLGQEYYSNVIFTQEAFGIDLCNCNPVTGAPFAGNVLFEELKLLKFQRDGKDLRVFDSTKGNTIPTGVFDFWGSCELPKGTYRLMGVGISGKEYYSDEATSPPNCKNSNRTLELKVNQAETDCGVVSSKAELRADLKEADPFISPKTLSYYIQKSDGLKLLRQFDVSKEGMGSLTIDTSTTAEGKYPVKAVLSYLDGIDNTTKEISASNMLIVDRILPAAQITYPTKSSMLCPIKTSGVNGDWYGLPIEGIATDNNAVNYYELYYGVGESPTAWLPAMTKNNGKSVQISGKGNLQGTLGVWDVTDHQGTTYSLKLKVVDVAGNVSCYTTSFSLDALTEIANLTIDKNLFSPNGDGILDDVKVNYQIDEYATVAVKVFKLIKKIDGSSGLDAAPVRTITAAKQHLGGADSVVWDGKIDGGAAAPDGKFGIAVSATDSCVNTAQKWTAVEVDNTLPTVAITYPKPGDPLGNIVEVKGTADDLHFKSYTLEAGQGSSPDAWSLVSTGSSPVDNNILGKWNTYGLTATWTLRLTAFDTAGNKNVTTVTIDLGARKDLIKDLSVSPRVFSPNADNKLDTATVTYELTDACNVMIEFLDSNNVVRRTYSTTVPSLGVYTFVWDGKDGAGVVVLDGAYTVRLTAILTSNTSVTQTETVTAVVDATLPVVDIKQPLNNSYTPAVDIVVSGTISDVNLSGYTINNGTTLFDQGNQTRENYAFGTLSSLPEGVYTLAVRATDQAQNETNKTIAFTVDRTPPVVKLDTPKNGEYYGTIVTAGSGTAVSSQQSATANITGSIVEKNLEVFNLRYGLGDAPTQWTDLATGATVTAYPSPFAWKVGKTDGIPDGQYTLSLYARDKAGLTGEIKVKIIIDNTPPTVAITSLHDGDYVKQAVDVKGTAFDQNLDKYTIDISEGQCATAFKWATIKTGTASVQDNVLGTWQALPADGDYCLKLTATDKVGSSSEAKVNVKVDTHPPTAPVLSGKVDNKTNASLAWTANTEPDLAGYNLYRNGQKVNTALITDIKYLDQNLAEGTYAYTLKAQDFAGWESAASNEVKIKIDLTGPDARVRSPQDGGRISGLNDIKGTAYSADDFKQYRLSIGQGATPSTWALIRTSPVPISYGVLSPWDTLGLAEGQVYSIKLDAEDISGNITTHQISVTIDNTPPATPFVISAAAIVSNATVTWRANTEPDLAGYLLYRNDQLANVTGIVVGNLQPYLIAGTTYPDNALPDGTFRYYLMAMDTAGNISDQSNTIEVTIDTRPPHATIIDPANASQFGAKIMVKAESPDLDIASVQFQYQSIQSSPTTTTDWLNIGSPVTSAAIATYLDPVAFDLTYGDYRVRAVATDKGNKTDPAPGFITVTYTDLTPPVAPIGLSALVSGGTVTLTWTANTEIDLAGYNVYRTSAGIRTKVNATLIAAAPQPTYPDSGLADDTYIYDVVAVDTHQNESKPSNQANAKVYAPVITQPYTPVAQSTIQVQGTHTAANANVAISVENVAGSVLRVAASADAAGAFTAGITLSLGENKITAKATDSSGNVSKDAALVVVVYNDTPSAPTGLAAAAQNSDVHLTWNSNPEADILGYNVFRGGVKLNASDAVVPVQIAASSSFDPYSYAPFQGMDQDPYTYWMPQDGTSAANPAWWEMDLALPQLISYVEIHWGTDVDASGNQIVYAGKDFEIQVWSGYAWITQVKVTGNTVKDNIYDFKPSYRTDRIRIYITDSTDVNSAKQIRLAEVGVTKDNLVAAGAQPAYDDLNLQNNQYGYAVTAVDNYGFVSALSSTATATIAIAPPSQPAVLTVSAVPTGLNATWVYAGSPAAGYNLYRSTTSGGPYTKINSSVITGTSFLDTDVLIGVTYYYVVTVVDNAGNEGAYSNEASGTAPVSVVPAKPVIFFPTATGMPITVFSNTTDISGHAVPGSSVALTGNGTLIGTAPAQPEDSVRSIPLNYDGNAAALSPDGKMLAYTFNDFLWLKTIITGAVTQAVKASQSVWSPDGRKIAYTYYDNNWNPHIGVYDLATGSSAPLTNDALVFLNYPSWSSDGSKVLFVQQQGAAPGVWMQDIVSGAATQIISTTTAAYPKLSSDGKTLAYFDDRSLTLYGINSNTSQVIDANTNGSSNEWLPDGKSLAFVSYRNGNGDIYILDIATGSQNAVPGSSGYPYNLAWTADGRHILFDIWDDTNNRDSLWMSDVSTLSQPVRIMPDLRPVYYVGSSRAGTIAFIDQNLQGAYIAHLLDLKGTFSFSNVPLTRGENIFTAAATDAAGNRSDSSDSISVTFDTRMKPDLAISPDDIYLYPPYPIAGDQMAVNAVVSNTSQVDISNVDVAVYVWNALGQLELLKSETIPTIAAGSSSLISATWNSTGKTGANRLVVVVDPDDKITESNESNNMAIKDFYVADHAGVSMNTSLDAVQYTSNQNANIAVTIWNTGPAATAVLNARIEDANGYPVSTFDTKTVTLAYAAQSIQTYAWNTGRTYTGPYVVHAVLKDTSGTVLADNTTPFTILSDAADDLTVVTDKIAYGPKENVITSFTIKNSGTNSIIPTLQAKVTIGSSSQGTGSSILYTETKNITNLLPGASVDLSSVWNTGLNLPGDYQAVVEVSFDNGQTTTKSAAFKINTLLVLTGTITATPPVVPLGNTTQVTYTFANSGNADALGYTARITIIDPETQTVTQTQDILLDIAQNSSKSGQISVNTSGYGLKTYTAVLQAVNQGTSKNLANTPFSVKDLTPPVVTITSPAPNGIFNAAVALSVTAVDNASGVDKVEYQMDSGLWGLLATADPAQGRYATTWNPLPADNGSHTINFRATDKAGNTSAPVSVTFTVQSQADITPPTGSIEINSGAAYTNNPAATLTLGCTDTGSGCAQMQFSSDNVTWSTPEAYGTAKPWQLTTGDGPKTVYVKYIDAAGNVSTAYSAVITLDTTPPVLTLSALPNNAYTNNNTLNIAGTATDNIALAGVTINTAEITLNADGTFSQAVKLMAGPNAVTTIASDMAGNTTTDTRTIILDQTAPVVTITYPHDNSVTNKADLTITGMVDKPATVSIKVNNGTATPAIMDGLNFSLPVTLIYGQNTIEVTATDIAGNTGTGKRTVIFDNVNPSLAVTNPAQDIMTNQPGLLLQGTVTDLTDITVAITFDGVASTPTVTAGAFQQQLTFTEEKTYAVIVTATDGAGNTSTVQRNIIYDKTPPLLTINPVTTPTNIMNQQVSGTMEAGAIVTVTCPTAGVGGMSYPTTTTWQTIIANMTEGDNVVSATAADQAGNVSAPVTVVIVLDTLAPDTLILSNPPALTNINGAGFTFTSTEAGSTFECKLDQGAYAACTSPANFVNLLDGAHTLQVRATDAAGNMDQTPAAYTWLVDTIPPVAVVTGMPQSPTRTTGAVLSVSGDDIQAYKYQLDSGAYSPESAAAQPIVLTGLGNGTHTVSVTGKDSAGNWQREESATVVSWLVDLEPPVLTISTLPNGAYTNNKILNISGTATDNVAVKDVAVNGMLVTLNADNTFSQVLTLATGTNTITSIASDTAGSTATDTRTIILDQTAPVVTITYPSDNSITNQPNITVTGYVDKPSTVSIKLNNGTAVAAVMDGLNFSLPITLVYGQNTIEATALDHVGNAGTAKRTVTMDNVNPALAVTNPSQDISTNQPGVLLQGTVADLTDLTVTITHDGNTYMPTVTNGTFQQQLTFSTEKVYAVIVTATDAAGNSSTVQRNIIYDKTPPALTINPVLTPTNTMIQQLSGTKEAGSTVTVTCPTAMIGEVSYPTETTWQAIIADMIEGNNVISAIATDLVGNVSAPVNAAILLDTHTPVTTPSPAPGMYSTAVSISLATNETAIIYYTVNGTVPTTSSPVYAGPLVITTNTTLQFFAVDLVGNREAVKSALYTINDDITPPITTIIVSSPNYTAQVGKLYVTNATLFTATATDNLSGVAKTECRIDSGAWTPYAPFTVLGEGSHTVSCRSIDNRGNVETPKTLAVIVDNTPPVTTITVSNTKCGSSPITPTTPITLAATDTISGVRNTEYAIDNGVWSPYVGAFTLTGYADGAHTITYRSTDNVGNVETAKNKTVTISRKKTTLSYTGPTLLAQGKAATLSGTLQASDGTALSPFGQTITFTIASGSTSQSCIGTTDAQGKASCDINIVTVPIGKVTITASFSGDATYMPATASKSGIVFGYAATGTFVIGDKNAVVNKSVTFWGAQWSSKNSLSNGSAPSSFKGYADVISPNPPDCKGAWTSNPGNSSEPPSSIPSYMAAIASSKITKSGNTISGNAVTIVIVKTNAGYASDPGHAGTGTVVGVLCGGCGK